MNPLLLDKRYSLRGCQLLARRSGATANTRCLIHFGGTYHESRAIAYPPDIRAFLSRLWNVEMGSLLHLPAPSWGEEFPPIFHNLAEIAAELRILEGKRGHEPFMPDRNP